MDARVKYTKMVIENCFIKLLEIKPAAKITVTEICRQAQINRATFYKHYLDIPDLLEQIENRLLRELKDVISIQKSAEELTSEYLVDNLAKMLQHIKDGALLYMILAGENGDPSLPMKTFYMTIDLFQPILLQHLPNTDEVRQQMLHHYLTLGCGGALVVWIKNGMKEDCNEMAKLLLKISAGAVSGISK